MPWLEPLLAIGGGLLLVYAVALVSLWLYARKNPGTIGLGDVLRLLPEMLRFLGRLVSDRKLPLRPRLALLLLLAYLASPIDLVPDFIPVIGYADDVLIVALVLRLVVRTSGRQSLERHWTGSGAGLLLVEKLAGLAPTSPGPLPGIQEKRP
ncbi:hypothetical protein DQ353_19520 [Arthrobacter sp. AQ5-05]|uniref:YkvA family protein n=1 Tax=Arthrobacter sp. AQ5-05 TaxID=2184581 RepID=UPI000DCC522C|nr:DUF1232 domain-containing protein [Arthrobacter sp. AQ5-05]RAX46916.1 hypothetical protein DQ353_19520 [Arthrobacter sp. AQ5-05]